MAYDDTPSSRLLLIMYHPVSRSACKIGGVGADSPSPSSILNNEATYERTKFGPHKW
jgi:hypothetical protein